MRISKPTWRTWRRSPADGINKNLLDLISQLSGLPPGGIRPESRILHDLGISGDDAVELLTAFAREFNVNLSEFPFDQYFPDEASFSFRSLWTWLLKLAGRRVSEMDAWRPITVADLERAAELGRWKPDPS